MSAPVTSTTFTPAATSASGATAGNAAVSLNPLTDTLFASMLSSGLSCFTMSPTTTPVQGQNVTGSTAIANTDTKNTFSLQNALLVSTDNLNATSQQDLKSLLANFGDTSNELTPKILVALAPGVPVQETLDNIKAQFTNLGIDTSKFISVAVATTAPTVADNALTVGTSDAAQSANFLLITTGFTPSEMGFLKDAIKSISPNGKDDPTTNTSETATKDNSVDVNASAAIVMMVFVAPLQKPTNTPLPQDMNFDISTLSAFTQPNSSDIPEPDWTKKLSEKLSSMSLTDSSASPFDDEMNAILSPTTPKEMNFSFKGDVTTASTSKKADGKSTKDITGDISPQATLATNQLVNLTSSSLQTVNSDGTLMINNNMITVQNMPSSMTNPIFTSASAIATHPSIQAVAQMIEKAASGSEKAKQELTVQLDPPELGRMQVQLSLEKDGVMKVHLLTEKQETLNLFQRDAHALKSALDNAGIKIDSSSLTFDMASGGDQSFQQLMGGSQNNNQSGNGQSSRLMGISAGALDSNALSSIDTKMDFTPNSITGNVHYSFWA
jgi:flagellar hook-length control protein FliK